MEINYRYIKNDDVYPSLLVLHGWGTSLAYMECFDDIKGYNVLLVDLPGFGKSLLKRKYDIDDYVEDIKSLLEEMNIDYFYGLGHSFGGKILTYYCAKYPCMVKKLFLIAPSVYKRKTLYIKNKIFIYHILKRMKFELPNKKFGSKDYQNASGYLRETLNSVTNAYLSKKELKEINKEVYLFAFKNDKEVKLGDLKKVAHHLPYCNMYLLAGGHFSYFMNIRFIKSMVEKENING